MNALQQNALRAAIIAAASVTFSFAGDNALATVAIDMDPATLDVDSQLIVFDTESDFWVAIIFDAVKNLDTYSVGVWYDTAALTYRSGLEEDAAGIFNDRGNVLKANGGATVGLTVHRDRGDDTLELVNTLSGADTAQAPDGFGLAALLRFTPKPAVQSAALTIAWAELGDSYQLYDFAHQVSDGVYQVSPRCTLVVKSEGPGTTDPVDTLIIARDSAVSLVARAAQSAEFIEWRAEGDAALEGSDRETASVTVGGGLAVVTAVFDYETGQAALNVARARHSVTISAGSAQICLSAPRAATGASVWTITTARGAIVARNRIALRGNTVWRLPPLAAGAYCVYTADGATSYRWNVMK